MDAVGNAEATDEQCRESDKDECCGNLVQPLGNPFAALGKRSDFPSRIRECLLEFLKPGIEILLCLYPVFVIHAATRANQPGCLHGLLRYHDRQAAPIGVQAPIRLLLDKTADSKGGGANLNLVANRLAQAFCQQWINNGAPLPFFLGCKNTQGFIRCQLQLAVKGIEGIQNQYLGPEEAVTAASAYDGIEFPHQRNVAGSANPFERLIGQRLAGIQLHIATEQRPGICQQTLLNHPVQAGCGRDKRDAKNQAGQENLQCRDT